jgi:glycosyltransferase involved in cell wall biosynthesis
VLRHEVNKGKGTALKTGFSHIAEAYPGEDVVCADADGQHSVADIRRVAESTRSTGRITLGVRRFDGDVPLRSRVGNTATRLLFRAATGHGVQDTQTGLRAYPGSLLSWLGSVPGDRFEYEMNALLHATRDGHPMEQVVVSTAYVQDNASSHFSPLSDSARIYLPLIRFAAASVLASSTTRR